MQLEPAFVAALKGTTDVTNVVGQRIRFGEHKPEAAALPDLYFDVANAPYRPAYGGLGDDTLREAVIEIVVRALDQHDMLNCALAVGNLIRGLISKTVTVGAETGKPFIGAILEDEGTDLPDDEITIDGTTRAVFRRSVLCLLHFRSSGYPV